MKRYTFYLFIALFFSAFTASAQGPDLSLDNGLGGTADFFHTYAGDIDAAAQDIIDNGDPAAWVASLKGIDGKGTDAFWASIYNGGTPTNPAYPPYSTLINFPEKEIIKAMISTLMTYEVINGEITYKAQDLQPFGTGVPIPLDGGLSFLLASGIGLGLFRKFKSVKK